jgi:hypothetical protein
VRHRRTYRRLARRWITRSSSRGVYLAGSKLTYTQLIEPAHQVFGTQVGIAAQHLHGLVAGDRRDLLVAETGLDQARDRLVTQVMKTQPLDAGLFQRAVPGGTELVRPTRTIQPSIGLEWRSQARSRAFSSSAPRRRSRPLPGAGLRILGTKKQKAFISLN